MAAWKRIIATLAVTAAPFMLAACTDPPPLYVDGAWIRLSANPDSPSAGYFTVHGGAVPVQLRGVLSDRVQRIEMHESMAGKGGMMEMKPIDAVDIPAEKLVAFAPGGKHLMMFRVNAREARNGAIPLTFLFSNGDRIMVDAVLQNAGGAAPDTVKAGNATAEHEAH
jgi:copper(I)-binding protein